MASHGDIIEHSPVPYNGRFARFSRILGEGAAKRVYAAVDKDHGKLVAWNEVDIRHVPPEQRELLEAEVGLLRAVRHVNIIDFYGSWATDSTVVFITEIVESGDLRRFYSTHHVKLKVIKKWCRQILGALAYLHEHSPPIVHRDIKCENLLYNTAEGIVKVGDLGLSCAADVDGGLGTDSRLGACVRGTPAYMAPEMYEGVVNEGVDIYAFGMAVLEMISHAPPYSECTNSAQIFKRVMEGVKPLALSRLRFPALADFINFCITTKSELRPSAQQVLAHPFLDENLPMPEDEECDLILPDDAEPGDGISPSQPHDACGATLGDGIQGANAASGSVVGGSGSGGGGDGSGGGGGGGAGGGGGGIGGVGVGGDTQSQPIATATSSDSRRSSTDETGTGWEVAPPSATAASAVANFSSASSLLSSGEQFPSRSSFFEMPAFQEGVPSSDGSPNVRGDIELRAHENSSSTPFSDGPRSFPIEGMFGERAESFTDDNIFQTAFVSGSFSEAAGLAMATSFGDGVLSPHELDVMLSPAAALSEDGLDNVATRAQRNLALSHVSVTNGAGAGSADDVRDRVADAGDGSGSHRNADAEITRPNGRPDNGGSQMQSNYGVVESDFRTQTSGEDPLLRRGSSSSDLEHVGSLPKADFLAVTMADDIASRLWVDSNSASEVGTENRASVAQALEPGDFAGSTVGPNSIDSFPGSSSTSHTDLLSRGSIDITEKNDGEESSSSSVADFTPNSMAVSTPGVTLVEADEVAKQLTTPPAAAEPRTMYAGRTPMLNGRDNGPLDASVGSGIAELISLQGPDVDGRRGNGAGSQSISVFSDDLDGSAALNLFSPPLVSSTDGYNSLASLISPVNLVPFTPQQRQNTSPRIEASPDTAMGQSQTPASLSPAKALAQARSTTFPLELVLTRGVGSATPASVKIQFSFDSAARADAEQVTNDITQSLVNVFGGSEDIDWSSFRPLLASMLETQRHGFAVVIKAEAEGLLVSLSPATIHRAEVGSPP